jgi:hypothetical protein
LKINDASHLAPESEKTSTMQAERSKQVLQIFDIDCYEFRSVDSSSSVGETQTIREEHTSEESRPLSDGIVRNVGAVLLMHRLEHVHVLLLHYAESNSFRLPGGKMNQGENIEECLHRTVREDLAPQNFTEITWRVQEYLGCWWQPQFTSKEMPLVLSQVSRPKQVSSTHFKNDLLPIPSFNNTS